MKRSNRTLTETDIDNFLYEKYGPEVIDYDYNNYVNAFDYEGCEDLCFFLRQRENVTETSWKNLEPQWQYIIIVQSVLLIMCCFGLVVQLYYALKRRIRTQTDIEI